MHFRSLLDERLVFFDQNVRCKKHLFETLSEKVFTLVTSTSDPENDDFSAIDLFTRLTERDKLGSSYINYHIALPSLKIAGVGKPQLMVLKLSEFIELQSHQQVDLVFVFIVPEQTSLGVQQMFCELRSFLNNRALAKALRMSKNSGEFFERFSYFDERNEDNGACECQ